MNEQAIQSKIGDIPKDVAHIAIELGCNVHQVKYIIRKLNILHSVQYGMTKTYNRAARERIRDEWEAQNKRRHAGSDAGPPH